MAVSKLEKQSDQSESLGKKPSGIEQAQVDGWRQGAQKSIAGSQITEMASAIVGNAKGAIIETGKFWQGMHDGMHEFVDETGQSLAVARDYYGEALTGNVNLGADVKEFGTATTSAIGQTLGTAGDYYFGQVPKGQAKLGNDIGQAGNAIANHWNSLDTEQKGHFFGKQVVPLLVPGAVGIVAKEMQGANLIGKAGQAITSFRGAQLIPVYAEGFAPARAIAAANVGQIADDGTDLTLPGMLLMSQGTNNNNSSKIRWGSNDKQEAVNNNTQPKIRFHALARTPEQIAADVRDAIRQRDTDFRRAVEQCAWKDASHIDTRPSSVSHSNRADRCYLITGVTDGNPADLVTRTHVGDHSGSTMLTVREILPHVDSSQRYPLGPQIKLWVQHFPPPLNEQMARQADQIFCCFPNVQAPWARAKHILSKETGSMGFDIRIDGRSTSPFLYFEAYPPKIQ